MSMREAVEEAAKAIYTVHDEVKDKDFELEMGWICGGDGGDVSSEEASASGGRFQRVPAQLFEHAVTQAKAALADSDSDDE